MQQISSKGANNSVQQGGKVDPLWTVQKINIWPQHQMVYAQTRIVPRKWDE